MRAQALRSSSTTFTGHDRKLDWTQAGRHMGCGKHRWWLYLLHCDASPMFKSSTSLKLNIGTFLSGEIFKKSMEDVHNKILLWFKNVLQQNKRTFLQNLSFFLSCFHSFIHSLFTDSLHHPGLTWGMELGNTTSGWASLPPLYMVGTQSPELFPAAS